MNKFSRFVLKHQVDKWDNEQKHRFKQDVKDIIDSYGGPKHKD